MVPVTEGRYFGEFFLQFQIKAKCCFIADTDSGVKCLSAMAVTEPLSFLWSRQALSWIMNLYARLDMASIEKYTTDVEICISEACVLFFPARERQYIVSNTKV